MMPTNRHLSARGCRGARRSLVLLILQCGLAACATPVRGQVPLSFDTRHVHDGVQRFRVVAFLPNDTVPRPVGTRVVESRRIVLDGAPAVAYVSSFITPMGSIVDTVTTRLDGLRPVSERSHQPTKTMELHFDDRHVTGVVTPAAGADTRIDQMVAEPVLNSTDIDLIVSSLPMRVGSTLSLPMYTWENGGLEHFAFTVTKEADLVTSNGSRPAWIVAVDMPRAAVTIWVDRATRGILRRESITRATGLKMVTAAEP